jgi:D-amino-acid dehydrogenase
MKHIGVIGGGVVGMCSAYYLQRAGHRVTIIDQGDMRSGCSFGNAGMIVPSHFIPLAAPGMISKGVRWMFNSSSPFYVRPRLNRALLAWGWAFYRNATKRKVAKAAPVLHALSLFSKDCYKDMARDVAMDLKERGLMMLFRRKETGDEENEMVEMAHELGMEAKVLSAPEVQDMEPNVKVQALGGIFFPGDAHVTPSSMMNALRERLVSHGVTLLTGEAVTGFDIHQRTVRAVFTRQEKHSFDEIVLATGAWSQEVASRLNLNLPMQAGKGYSFTLKNVGPSVTIPTIFLDDRVAVTPMGNDLRFGGTMEIGGINHDIDTNRVKGIVDAIPRYYPDMNVSMPDGGAIWHGLRPCSPDGLPFIGRAQSIRNLIVAAGHGMMGISLGPGTGKLVAEIAEEKQTSVDLGALRSDRFA